jgi:hypothetical protein
VPGDVIVAVIVSVIVSVIDPVIVAALVNGNDAVTVADPRWRAYVGAD